MIKPGFGYLFPKTININNCIYELKSWFKGWDNFVKRFLSEDAFKILDLNKKDYFLEIGPGGSLAFSVEASKKSKMVYCIDSCKNIPTYLKNRRKPENLNFVLGNCNKLPFANNFFDKIFISDVIPVLKNPKKCISEIFRVLKTNGLLLTINGNNYPLLREVWEEQEMKDFIIKINKKNKNKITANFYLKENIQLHQTQSNFYKNPKKFIDVLLKSSRFSEIKHIFRVSSGSEKFICRLLIKNLANNGEWGFGKNQMQYFRELKYLESKNFHELNSGLFVLSSAKKL